MKNRKGSVPALLTLGLVLVGSLVTIGISFLTNNNKIALNPRAGEKIDAGYCCVKYIDGKNYSCPNSAIQNVGKYCPNTDEFITCGGYSSCDGLYLGGNIESSGTCESYGAPELASQGIMCVGGGPIIPGTAPEGCENKTCSFLSFGNSDHDVSYYTEKPKEYYFDKNCSGDPVNRTVIQDAEHCLEAVQGDCAETPCGNFNSQLTELDGYDKGFVKKNTVFTKTGDPKFYDGKPCDVLNETTLLEACIPPAPLSAPTCDFIFCNTVEALILRYPGITFGSNDGAYHWSDKPDKYYKYIGCNTSISIETACPIPETPETPPEEPLTGFSCSGMESYTNPQGKVCSCYVQDLNGGAQISTSYATFSSFCTNTCHGNPYLGKQGFANADNGYCCPKDCGG